MVSPVSFRHPAMLVRVASAVADLSGGRLQFGIGAGWMEREHTMYGYPLGNVPERMTRFREATRIMCHLLRTDKPLTFSGRYYSMRDAVLLPRPAYRVPIVIGGSGRHVTLPLVVRYADEWNCGVRSPEQFTEINGYLDDLLDKAGRPRSAVRRSMMIFLRFGRDQAELQARLAANPVPEPIRNATLVGTGPQIKEQVHALGVAGVQRVILNWRDDYDDLSGIEALARAVLV
jgi:alkanesulfonate monooxygenase SsuD/methylene tetrahydromethanopterin reductase-like flavin-dependent oxidoreductase (luciferase family)